MNTTMQASREAHAANSTREETNNQGEGGQGSANDESSRDQVPIPASILDDILRQQHQLNDAIHAISQACKRVHLR